MKLILILCLWICGIATATGQILTILDDESGRPVELAIVTSDNTRMILMTDEQGEVEISSFARSSWIEVKCFGYQTDRIPYKKLDSLRFIIHLKRDHVSLEQVVISGTRWNQAAKDIPAKVSMITSLEIALQNPQTAADMLGGSGEIFIQKSQQGGGSPMIRGFATNRLLYAVDGVRMNNAIFRGGNIQNVINLDPFATERVEVLFGPGSVMYGSDAIGGVMSFQTLTPKLSFEEKPLITGNANWRASSANKEWTGHVDLNIGWRKWAILTSLTSFDFGNLRMGGKGPEEYLRPFYVQRQDQTDIIVANPDPLVQRPSGYAQQNIMQKILFRPSDAWDIRYALHYSATSSYSRYDRHIRYRQGLPRYGEWDYGPQTWMMNYLMIRHQSSLSVYDELVVRLAHQRFGESRIERNIQDVLRHHRSERVDALSANVDLAKSWRKRNRVLYGIEMIWNDVESMGEEEDILSGIRTVGPARYPQATWASLGIYVNLQHRFSEKILIQTGARYNRFELDAEFDTRFYPFPFTTANFGHGALTGNLGITFTPTSRWTMMVNASTGFRAPNVDDSGKVFDAEPGYVMVPNPDLQAEYAYNVELGIAHQLGEEIKADVAVYYTHLSDAMVRRDFLLDGMDSIVYDGTLSKVQALQNAAVARVYGVQAGIDIQLASGFFFSSDLNYQKGEEELDDGLTSPSRHAAPFFGTVRVGYKHDGLQLMVYTNFSAKREFEDLPPEEQAKPEIYAIDPLGRPYSPAWATLHFKAQYQVTDYFSIGAGLENITDVRYRPYSSGIVASGRNVMLSIGARF